MLQRTNIFHDFISLGTSACTSIPIVTVFLSFVCPHKKLWNTGNPSLSITRPRRRILLVYLPTSSLYLQDILCKSTIASIVSVKSMSQYSFPEIINLFQINGIPLRNNKLVPIRSPVALSTTACKNYWSEVSERLLKAVHCLVFFNIIGDCSKTYTAPRPDRALCTEDPLCICFLQNGRKRPSTPIQGVFVLFSSPASI